MAALHHTWIHHRVYLDILTGGKIVVNLFIGQFVDPVEGEGIGWMEAIVILATLSEYIKTWCNIQLIIYIYYRDLKG